MQVYTGPGSALNGKTIIDFAGATTHTMALCSDGTVAAWGKNDVGQLGNGTTTNSLIPVKVFDGPGSALNGKTVIQVAATQVSSLAVCSDGTVAQWGNNGIDQAGNPNTAGNKIPINMSALGALKGKKVTQVAGGYIHVMAVCDDGTAIAWGYNGNGQLGTGNTTDSLIPIKVSTATGSALAGKTVTQVSAGYLHSGVLCSDGTIATWGQNSSGELGIGTTTSSLLPKKVSTGTGSALAGKTVTQVSTGASYTMALCSDGALTAWGFNGNGQLGNGTTTNSSLPKLVSTGVGSALNGKKVVQMESGTSHSMALCSDNTLTTWGGNSNGELGNGTTTGSALPVKVSTGAPSALGNNTVTQIIIGTYYSLAVVKLPQAPYIISGTVTTPSGTAISGAVVTDGTHTTTTNALGKYILTGLPAAASVNLTATKANYIITPNPLTFVLDKDKTDADFIGVASVPEKASLVVTTLTDVIDSQDGETSLSEAIAYANSGSAGANPVVTFKKGLSGTIKLLTNDSTDVSSFDLSHNMTIQGPTTSAITLVPEDGISHFFVEATVEIDNLTLSDANVVDTIGGAIFNIGNLTVKNCIFTNNRITGTSTTNGVGGGAIFNASGTLNVDNCTFTNNVLVSAFLSAGAAIYNANTMQVTNSTFTGNSSYFGTTPDFGGAISNGDGASTTISNSILAGDIGSEETDATSTFGADSIVGGTAAAAGLEVDGNGNAVLKDNGGPTFTVALVAGGKAVDIGKNQAATNRGLTTDQRGPGYVRIYNNTVDAGAFELQPPPKPSVADINKSLDEDTSLTFAKSDFESAFTEPYGNRSLTRVQIVTLPSNGTLTLNGAGVTVGQEILADDLGKLVYTPNANFNGSDSFTYTAGDAVEYAPTAATVKLTVKPVNDAPSISGTLVNQTTLEDTPTTPQTFKVGDIDTALDKLKVTGTSSNTSVVADSGISIIGTGADRVVVVTPVANAFGTTTITLSVTDDGTPALTSSNTLSFVVTVTPVNDLPVISGLKDTTIDEDNVATISFNVSDIETPATSLTVTATNSNSSLVPDSAVVVSGSGTDRTLTLTPLANAFGQTTITVTAKDADGAVTTSSFVLTVNSVDDAPTSQGLNLTGKVGELLTFSLPATDLEGDPLTYEFAYTPGDATFGGGQLGGTAPNLTFISYMPGTYKLVFRVRDSSGLPSGFATVTIVITGTDGLEAMGRVVSSEPNASFTASVQVPMPNARVQLEQGKTVLATTLTDSQGRYLFQGLNAGKYTVHVVSADITGSGTTTNLTFVLAESMQIKVTKKTAATTKFEAPTLSLYSIWGQVGVKSGEKKSSIVTPLPGATVQLRKSNSATYPALSRTATTDANGYYVFKYLGRARFGVEASAQSGLTFPASGAGVTLPGTKKPIAPSARFDIIGSTSGGKTNKAPASVHIS